MKILTGPNKNEIIPIEISKTKFDRIIIGLSWDPIENKSLNKIGRFRSKDNGMIKNIFSWLYDIIFNIGHFIYLSGSEKGNDTASREKKHSHYDLDLHSYAFDHDQNFLYELGPNAHEAIDESSKTYHSGEDYSGMGGNDDERIAIETKKLPENYSNYIVVVKSDSKNLFSKIDNPVIRIADGKTEENFSEVNIAPNEQEDNYAYIYAKIFKYNDQWNIKLISEYVSFDQDWPNYLKKYLS